MSVILQTKLFEQTLKAKIDARTLACRVNVDYDKSAKTVTITGYVLFKQFEAFIKKTAEEIFNKLTVVVKVKVLAKGKPKFAEVKVPSALVWKTADESNPETVDSEALIGSIVRVFFTEGKFAFIQQPDGYVGYIRRDKIQAADTEKYLRWKNGKYALLKQPLKIGDTTLPIAARLIYENGEIVLPDGSRHKVAPAMVRVEDPADPAFIKAVMKHSKSFNGTPYLWGGKSEVGIDCSGFMQTLCWLAGIKLPRDASMQMHVGEFVGILPNHEDLLPGDLLFFMNDNAFVFHVGMYIGDMKYIHSSGKAGVSISAIPQGGENYMERYGKTYVYARRVK